MPASPRRAAARRALALLLPLCLAIAPAASGRARPRDDGGWTRVATWTSRRPTRLYEALDWPAGHVPGGVGAAPFADRVAATDLTAHTVRAYGRDGTFLAEWGGPGSAPGRFRGPRDVAPLPDGRWAVSDTGNDRVQILSAAGAPEASWPVAAPRGVAVAARGLGFPDADVAVYVASGATGRVRAFAPDGTERDGVSLDGVAALDGLTLGAVGGAPGGPLQADLTAVDRAAGPPEGAAGRALGAAWHVPAAGGAAPRFRWPGLSAALALRAPSTSPNPPADDIALLAGADGLGLMAVASSGATGGPEAVLPFESVTDLAGTAGGTLLAAVRPEGLVLLGDDADALFAALRQDTAGRLFAPRVIAAGIDVVVGDALPRAGLWTTDGAPIVDLPAPTGPLAPEPAPPADVAQDGALRVVLRADGALHLIEARRYTRFYEPRASAGRRIVAVAARGSRIAALDLLRQEVVLLDDRLTEVGTWPLSDAGAAYVGALDIALSDGRVFLARPGDGLLDIRTLVGTPVRTVVVPGGIERVASLPDGGAVVLTPGGRAVRFDGEGNALDAWPVGEPGDLPSDLAVDVYGRLLVADARGEVRVYAPRADEGRAGVPPRPAPGACSMGADKRALPRDLTLGEAVSVQLVLDGACAEAPPALEIALVVDRSQSMAAGGRLSSAVDAALSFTARANPLATRLAVVAFDGAAAILRPLTADRAAVATRLVALAPGGAATDLVGALRAGTAAVSGPDARPRAEARRVVVLLTDGRHTATSPPRSALDAAVAEAAAAGVTTYAIGLGPDPDREALRAMAGDGARVHASPSPRDLAAIYGAIARALTAGRLLETVSLVDVLPANMAYVPGSGTPLEPAVDPDGRTLRWTLTEVPEPGLALAYRVVPQSAGIWPTNVEARADGRDAFGLPVRFTFPVPYVGVTDPRVPSATPTRAVTPTDEPTPTARPSATPSATPAASATSSATASPTASATPRRTATPTPTRRPTRWRLYCPLGFAPHHG